MPIIYKLPPNKKCSHCNVVKPQEDFYIRRDKRKYLIIRLTSRCKICISECRKEQRKVKNNQIPNVGISTKPQQSEARSTFGTLESDDIQLYKDTIKYLIKDNNRLRSMLK